MNAFTYHWKYRVRPGSAQLVLRPGFLFAALPFAGLPAFSFFLTGSWMVMPSAPSEGRFTIGPVFLRPLRQSVGTGISVDQQEVHARGGLAALHDEQVEGQRREVVRHRIDARIHRHRAHLEIGAA